MDLVGHQVNAMPAADRASGGAGTQTAAIIGGAKGPPSATKSLIEYDGTNLDRSGDLITEKICQGCAGTQTAALNMEVMFAPSGYPTASRRL